MNKCATCGELLRHCTCPPTPSDSAMTAERLAEIVQKYRDFDVGEPDTWIADNWPLEAATLIEALTAERTKLAADLARVEGERDALKSDRARSISRGRILIRVRDALINIKEGIESEVDRTYFGSMNDADMFCEIVGELDTFKWDRIMAEKPEPDVIEECRKANARALAAEAKSARLEEALRKIETIRRTPWTDLWDTDEQRADQYSRVIDICVQIANTALTLPEPSHEP